MSSVFFNLLASFRVFVFLFLTREASGDRQGGQGGQGAKLKRRGGQAQTQGGHGPLAPPLATGLRVGLFQA